MALIHLLPEAALTFNYKVGVENIQQLKLYNPNVINQEGNIVEIGNIFHINTKICLFFIFQMEINTS